MGLFRPSLGNNPGQRQGQSLDEDDDDKERETEQNEGTNGEERLQGSVLEGGRGDQVAELRGHPDSDVDRDDQCPDLERGRVVDPCAPDESCGGEYPHQPGEEDLLGGSQPVL